MSKARTRVTFHFRLSSIIAVFLVFVVSLQMCSAQPTALDGVTLYRALFFASGPLGQKIPTLQKARPFLPPDYVSMQDTMIKQIRQKDPKFFDTFAAEIQSGDHVRVAAELLRANAVQRDTLRELTKTRDTQFAKNVQRLTPEILARPVETPEVEGNVAVFVIAIVLIVALAVVIAPEAKPEALKGLSFERYVNEIVQNVPAASTVTPRPHVQ